MEDHLHTQFDWEDLTKLSPNALKEYETFRKQKIANKEFEVEEWRALDWEGLAPGIESLPDSEPNDVMPLLESTLKKKYLELLN